jgi:hypothetical protein
VKPIDRALERRRNIAAMLAAPAPVMVLSDEDEDDEDYEPDDVDDGEDDEDDDVLALDAAPRGYVDVIDEEDDLEVLHVRRGRDVVRVDRRAVPPPAPAPTFTLDLAADRRTACRICCSIIEQNLLRLRQQLPAQAPGVPAAHPHHYHLSCFVHDPSQPRIRLSQLHGYPAMPLEIKVLVESLIPR